MSAPVLDGKASFALRGHNPDVLTCIANLSNDEVFTPPELANQMLDTLEVAWAEANDGDSIWSDPTVTFLDPFTKSGVFLREITRRLTGGLESQIPELSERVDHILTKQIYGIGITRLTAMLARRSLYCSKDATGKHSIAKSFDRDWGNIWFERTAHTWAGDRCAYCGASRTAHERSDELETHAYAFIHTKNPKARMAQLFGADVQFDVIIGNPPYQLDDGGFGSSAAPIYHRFVEQAKALEPRLLSVVIPARWYAGGKGLAEFRTSMLGDDRLRVLHDFPDTGDVFPGVNNRGGICYFLWDRDHPGDAEVYTHERGGITSSAVRPLVEPGLETFVRYNEGIAILRKVLAVEGSDQPGQLMLPLAKRFSSLVSSRKPFGLDTTFAGSQTPVDGGVRVYRNGGIVYAPRAVVTSGVGFVDATKLLVPYASPGSDDYPHLVLSKPIIAGPGEISTETYLVIGPFSNDAEARNVATYMGTQFFRFMLTLKRVSQHVTKGVYTLAPTQDFSRAWHDDDLAAKYGLSDEDRDFMARFVKPVSWAADYYA
ncbi:Eco57I restriction-modification methylase domain-containing protein [Microbacterium mcarthurae (nom. nud.)]|uniref:site-specific DNA-methyltransferase (adenine-specific) n=1 Tax=Microbacterium mcarthurae TaxID=3035918 RepID=A0ABW9GFK9_9MICO